jgi:hypothetical protein
MPQEDLEWPLVVIIFVELTEVATSQDRVDSLVLSDMMAETGQPGLSRLTEDGESHPWRAWSLEVIRQV